ncbi:MAG: hypothetical protein ACR2J3_05305 [Aridibacter sp.]
MKNTDDSLLQPITDRNEDDSMATSTDRTFSAAKNRDKAIGFRLARDDK